VVTISNSKDNTLEFDVDVQGIETDEMAVRFVIETGSMNLGFDSEKKAKNKWSVKIPALPILDATMYPFHINIVVDGYNFTPLQGSVNVVGTHEVYASAPENITLAPAKRKAKKVIQTLNKKPEEIGPTEPQQDMPAPTAAEPIVKPERKFKLEPLKVKDGQELFKTLMDKKPKIIPKKDDKLDDKIVDLMKQAKKTKEEKVEEPEKVKEPSKTVENPIATTAEEPKTKAAKKKTKKKVAAKKKVSKKKVSKKATPKKTGSAKNVAEKIIQSVTGLGKKQTIVENNPNDAKIKDIIKEDSTPCNDKPEKLVAAEPGGIKKIGKDKSIVEVDASKEQKIKDVLKEDAGTKKRSVTTKPFKKNNITFH